MDDTNHNTQAPETLAQLTQQLWDIKIFIAIGAALGLCTALIYLAMAQTTYKITMIVGPVPTMSKANIVNNAGDNAFYNSGDATTTLLNMHQSTYRTILRSPRIAGLILKMPDHVNAISQDKKYGLISIHPSQWSADDMSKYFEHHIRMTPVHNATDLIKISYTHPNPDFGQTLLRQLHAFTDETIRNDHKKLIDDRRRYITKALSETLNLDHKKALGYLLVDLERESIMVNSDHSYAMRVIDPPSSSAHPFYPRTNIVIAMMLFIGAFCGTFVGFCFKK